MISADEVKEQQKFMVRQELKIRLLKLIYNFKSEEEPDYGKLTNDDILNVLSSIIERRTR